MAKRKNAAAVALGRRSAAGRMKKMTPEQRSEQARQAVQTRWRKAKPPVDSKPTRWYGLFAIPSNNGVEPSGEPELLRWSRDKQELLGELRRRQNREDRYLTIMDVEYDPTRFTIVREFSPDVGAQVAALQALTAAEEGGQK